MTTNSIHIQGHRILFEMYEVILFTIGTLVIRKMKCNCCTGVGVRYEVIIDNYGSAAGFMLRR